MHKISERSQSIIGRVKSSLLSQQVFHECQAPLRNYKIVFLNSQIAHVLFHCIEMKYYLFHVANTKSCKFSISQKEGYESQNTEIVMVVTNFSREDEASVLVIEYINGIAFFQVQFHCSLTHFNALSLRIHKSQDIWIIA